MGLAPAFRLPPWFGMVFCLLLAPRCHQPSEKPGIALLPCRTFCEVLLDSCWTLLQESGLPVACHTLPEGPEPSQSCLTVSNHKGKTVMHLKLMPLVFYWCAFYCERQVTSCLSVVALLCYRFARAQTNT